MYIILLIARNIYLNVGTSFVGVLPTDILENESLDGRRKKQVKRREVAYKSSLNPVLY